MRALETASAQLEAASGSAPAGPQKRGKSGLGRFLLILLLFGGISGAVFTYTVGTDRLRGKVDQTITANQTPAPEPAPTARLTEPDRRRHWDGLVRISPADAKRIGLTFVKVRPQVEPIKLELPGHTAYDPNSLSKIRPRFDSLVERVHAELGQKVKKGDPLVDLYSTDLAAAKNDFQTAYVQWQHDLTLRKLREKLFTSNTISEQLLVDTRNDENKSRLAVTTARQKLVVLGVPEEQIDPLVKNLRPADLPEKDEIQRVVDKAKLTRFSPVDGIVIVKDVVRQNFYDANDVLMVIAPLDHLFVWINVYEADQVQVSIGQHLEIRFPYMDQVILGTVQYVATEVSKDTHAIRIRASIPNVDGKLKADMLVKALLDIPPVSGQTVAPRLAVVVMNGHEYAFVRKPPGAAGDDEKFERRKLTVVEERFDHIVVASGLKAGEEVASYGSLILAQLYEDQEMVETGMPLQ
jgi:cobalt-zinc-cadmium efflux system membrane fusion protein